MNKQMKIGIALSGGGLQGFAHIGALKALEDLGINNIKYISGTSTGSIVASLYAMGYNTNEIEKIWKENYKKILKIKKRTIIKMVFNYILKKKSKIMNNYKNTRAAIALVFLRYSIMNNIVFFKFFDPCII